MLVRNKVSNLTKTVIASAGFLLLSNNAFADDYNINLHLSGDNYGSLHYTPLGEKCMNEKNGIEGLGIGKKFFEIFIKHAKKNSLEEESYFLGVNYKHKCYGNDLRFCFGGTTGIITGYKNVREDGGPFPIVAFYSEVGYKNFSIEVYIPPTIYPEIVYNAKIGFNISTKTYKKDDDWKFKIKANSKANERSEVSIGLSKNF